MEKHSAFLGGTFLTGSAIPAEHRPQGQLDNLAGSYAVRADTLTTLNNRIEEMLVRLFGEQPPQVADDSRAYPKSATAIQQMYSLDTMLENGLNELARKLDRLSAL